MENENANRQLMNESAGTKKKKVNYIDTCGAFGASN